MNEDFARLDDQRRPLIRQYTQLLMSNKPEDAVKATALAGQLGKDAAAVEEDRRLLLSDSGQRSAGKQEMLSTLSPSQLMELGVRASQPTRQQPIVDGIANNDAA